MLSLVLHHAKKEKNQRYDTGRYRYICLHALLPPLHLQLRGDERGRISSINGIGQVRRENQGTGVADVIIVVADNLDLAGVNVVDSLVRERVAEDDSGADLVHVASEVIGSVVDRETTLGVATENNLGVGASCSSVADHLSPVER